MAEASNAYSYGNPAGIALFIVGRILGKYAEH